MNKYYKLSVFVLGLLWLGACEENNEEPKAIVTEKVLIINEGGFGAGNGSIATYIKSTENVQQGTFEALATVQNVKLIDGDLYVVSNAPGKIEIIDTATYAVKKTITEDLSSPFNVAAIGNKLLVSDWGTYNTDLRAFENSFYGIYDINTGNQLHKIENSYTSHDVEAVNGLFYIANRDSNTLTRLDPADYSTEDLVLAAGPSAIETDANNNLWVLCNSGDLFEIITSNFSKGKTLSDLQTDGYSEKMDLHRSTSVLYFLGAAEDFQLTKVFSVNLTETNLSAQVFVEDQIYLYGIGVDPANGDVYIGDNTNGFGATGTGFRFATDGTLIDDFPTGIGPNGFLFY